MNGRVVCRQLGFFGIQQITVGSHFGFTSGNFSMDDVACRGNETSINDCLASKTEDCFGGEAAGVVCDQREKAIVEERKIAECFVEDVTYWGSRINATLPSVTNAPECQEECAKNANCTHFTFLPIDIADKIQDCGKICLRDGIRPNTGILTLKHIRVCDHGFSSDYARDLKVGRVICRQLGYIDVVSVKSGSVHYGYTVDLCGSTLCKGDEERLEDCPNYYWWHSDYCNTLEVSCQDRHIAEGELLCKLFSGPEQGTNKSRAAGAITGPKICDNTTSSECAQQSGACLENSMGIGNGTRNGTGNETEDGTGNETEDGTGNGMWNKTGNGTRNRAGNVFFNGKPVCDDHWDFFNADIVCKELNFTGALIATIRSHFGRVPPVFSLDDVSCRGQESSLGDCFSSEVENCDGSEGAGVVCDTRSGKVRKGDDEKIRRECFSDARYRFSHSDGNWINLLHHNNNKNAAYIDSASSCQRACQHFEDCEVFHFSAEGLCYLGRLAEKKHIRSWKSGRSSTSVSGPRECNTETPVLLSYKGQNCSDSGVACVAGGSGPWEGIAHIGGRPICEDGWDAADARVFCRQMGFKDQDSHRFEGEHFGEVSGPFGMSELQCHGKERSVIDCRPKTPVTTCLQWEGGTCSPPLPPPLFASSHPQTHRRLRPPRLQDTLARWLNCSQRNPQNRFHREFLSKDPFPDQNENFEWQLSLVQSQVPYTPVLPQSFPIGWHKVDGHRRKHSLPIGFHLG